MNGWMDHVVALSENIATYPIYTYPNLHSHSYFIQCDINLSLKSSENYKSQVKATLPARVKKLSRLKKSIHQ
jgi:hypothetical protein